MAQLKRMDQIQIILQTFLETNSLKQTSRRLTISINTVRHYVRLAKAFNKDIGNVLALSEAEQKCIFYPKKTKETSVFHTKEQLFLDKVDYFITELPRLGVTRQLLWEEYRREYADRLNETFSYSQFCARLRQEFNRRDLTTYLDHPPGIYMQVDFTGKKMKWVDAQTTEAHEVEILVVVLPHSQQTFVLALPSQKAEYFVKGLNTALLFFGKLPQVILSDNLKSYVTKSDRYYPKFHQFCEQLAAHYQVDLDATRVAKPRDKASVENMVSTTYRRVCAPLRNEVFYSLEALNAAIKTQVIAHNKMPFQKREGCRQSIFEAYEKPQMRELPAFLFEIKKTVKAKIQRNYHIYLGEEKNYYSVHHRYVGKTAIVFYNTTTVEIFIDNQRVAIHERIQSSYRSQYQTKEEHMPANHLEWKRSSEKNADYYERQAQKIGAATTWFIQRYLKKSHYPPQAYKGCQGILSMAKRYTNERLERACQMAQKVGVVNYTFIKNILQNKKDLAQQIEETEEENFPFAHHIHDNIRGPEAYQ